MSLLNIVTTTKSLPIDDRMDRLYDYVDDRMALDEWLILDRDLDEVINNFEEIDLDILLGIVCVTLPGEDKLASRSVLMAKCKDKYPDPYLWVGL